MSFKTWKDIAKSPQTASPSHITTPPPKPDLGKLAADNAKLKALLDERKALEHKMDTLASGAFSAFQPQHDETRFPVTPLDTRRAEDEAWARRRAELAGQKKQAPRENEASTRANQPVIKPPDRTVEILRGAPRHFDAKSRLESDPSHKEPAVPPLTSLDQRLENARNRAKEKMLKTKKLERTQLFTTDRFNVPSALHRTDTAIRAKKREEFAAREKQTPSQNAPRIRDRQPDKTRVRTVKASESLPRSFDTPFEERLAVARNRAKELAKEKITQRQQSYKIREPVRDRLNHLFNPEHNTRNRSTPSLDERLEAARNRLKRKSSEANHLQKANQLANSALEKPRDDARKIETRWEDLRDTVRDARKVKQVFDEINQKMLDVDSGDDGLSKKKGELLKKKKDQDKPPERPQKKDKPKPEKSKDTMAQMDQRNQKAKEQRKTRASEDEELETRRTRALQKRKNRS